MISKIRDVFEIIRISGLRGFRRLLGHSRRVKGFGAPFALMHCLIALEKAGLSQALRQPQGLDIDPAGGDDRAALAATCEYLYERGVLVRSGPHTYRVRDSRQFEQLTDAMHACLAYHEPINALDKLISGELRYGEHVARDDKYDALASATLTSIFSYGFAHRVLASSGARSVLDCGCGTGEFLAFLRRKGFDGQLFGLDLAPEAIEDGRSMGFEKEDVTLFVGDVLHLCEALSDIGSPDIDVFSFMFVLHEFEREPIGTILTSIRESCPKGGVLLTELDRLSSDDTRRVNRTMLPELKLVHIISRQILRSADDWKTLFAAHGFKATTERCNRLTSQFCILFEPE